MLCANNLSGVGPSQERPESVTPDFTSAGLFFRTDMERIISEQRKENKHGQGQSDSMSGPLAKAIRPSLHGLIERRKPDTPTTEGSPSETQSQSVDYWVERIGGYLAKGAEFLVRAGAELCKAKAALPHGHWTDFVFKLKLKRFVDGERMAQRLMQVAKNKALSNPTNWSLLPPCRSVLVE